MYEFAVVSFRYHLSIILNNQASILAHKKETLAETVQQQRDEAAGLQQELEQKRKTLQDLGGKVLKGDEVRMSI